MAKKMGLPINKFIAATNSNSIFTDFITSGQYEPQSSVKTLSNAMDVGAPSNIARIQAIYGKHSVIIKDIASNTHNDAQTIEKIKDIYQKYNYIIDPHGAVGMLAFEQFATEENLDNYSGIVVETAHPAKFKETVDDALGTNVELPEALLKCITKEKKTTKLSSDYSEFKEYLLSC